MGTAEEALITYQLPRPLPIWLNPAYARHIVKGNFMTLSAKPKTVEEGEWVAHHGMLPPAPHLVVSHMAADPVCLRSLPVVEHYRNLWNFVRVVYEKEEDGKTICNSASCPRMSAGAWVPSSSASVLQFLT